jgi:hypothetical protein
VHKFSSHATLNAVLKTPQKCTHGCITVTETLGDAGDASSKFSSFSDTPRSGCTVRHPQKIRMYTVCPSRPLTKIDAPGSQSHYQKNVQILPLLTSVIANHCLKNDSLPRGVTSDPTGVLGTQISIKFTEKSHWLGHSVL